MLRLRAFTKWAARVTAEGAAFEALKYFMLPLIGATFAAIRALTTGGGLIEAAVVGVVAGGVLLVATVAVVFYLDGRIARDPEVGQHTDTRARDHVSIGDEKAHPFVLNTSAQLFTVWLEKNATGRTVPSEGAGRFSIDRARPAAGRRLELGATYISPVKGENAEQVYPVGAAIVFDLTTLSSERLQVDSAVPLEPAKEYYAELLRAIGAAWPESGLDATAPVTSGGKSLRAADRAALPDAPSDRGVVARPPAVPLTLRQRAERFVKDVEGEIGRRDNRPLDERHRIGDNYAMFIPELNSIHEDLVRQGLKDAAGALDTYAYAEEFLSRGDVLAAADLVRRIKWEER